MSGLDVTTQLRRSSTIPIIVLTARSEETDRVVGLELGADDYVVKPFSPKELVARVRRAPPSVEAAHAGADVIDAADITIDVPRRRVTVGDKTVELTATEFDLVLTMARRPGQVFTRSQLLDAVHGVAFESYERAIDAHVKNIRRKLGRPAPPPLHPDGLRRRLSVRRCLTAGPATGLPVVAGGRGLAAVVGQRPVEVVEAEGDLAGGRRRWGAHPRLERGRFLLWRRRPSRARLLPLVHHPHHPVDPVRCGSGVRRTWAPMGSPSTRQPAGWPMATTGLVEPAGPPQLRQVMSAFNRMAGRIEAADEQRRRLLADLSHEPRTPLTVIQGSVEAMCLRGAPCGRRPPDSFARGDPGPQPTARRPTNRDACRGRSVVTPPRADRHRGSSRGRRRFAVVPGRGCGVSMTVDARSDLPEVELDPVRIREVVVNLVINALRHTPPEGSVIVDVATNPAGVLVSVRETTAPGSNLMPFPMSSTGSSSRPTPLGRVLV